MSEIIYGLYEQIINGIILENLNKVDQKLVIKDTQQLDSAESSKILADYLTRILREIFNYIDEGNTIVRDRVDLCNGILQYITKCIQKGSFSFKKDEATLKRIKSFLIQQDAQMLLSLVDKKTSRLTALFGSEKIVRPDTSISENSLFTGAVHEPSMVSELKKEILSSHRIDFLVSFIKWSGLRLIINELTQFTAGGGKLRVITTSYLGATDFKAVEQLSKLSNTEMHISYNSKELTEITLADFYDYIVIDEFHHAAAPSYQELLDYYRPKILLGLTATPERADGRSIYSYFEGRIAAEIRLWEAIERKLLSPFHYFGVTDNVDLSHVRWVAGKYDEREIENLFVFERAVAVKRVGNVIKAIEKYCLERSDIIGIGFCLTKKHAEFMSEIFNKSGIPSEFLIAESEDGVRDSVKRRLVTKEIKFVFVVDIYNEGIDIPEVNTVLFLRPTESLTVFLQQLGRGLRLSDGKEALTVLDFVGQAHKKYSFEDRFKALLSRTRKTVEHEIKHGFANVPRGCSIQLEKQAQDYILENIRNAVNNKRNLIAKLHDFMEIKGELNVREFFEGYHVTPQDVYSKKVTVVGFAAQAGLLKEYRADQERERLLASALGRLSFLNSRRWIRFIQTILPQIQSSKGILPHPLPTVERTMLSMFYYTVWGKGLDDLGKRFDSIEEAIYWTIDDLLLYGELLGLLEYQYAKIDFVDKSLAELGKDSPLDLYCSYTSDQILVALGKHTEQKKSSFREGVLYLSEKKLDVFFVTLNKSEKDYSPSTMYQDYSINEELFHWQSQSRTTEESVTGQRYINQAVNGGNVLFFVREYKVEEKFTSPYTCMGLADFQSHYGSAPISIVWKMKESLPGFVMKKTVKV